MAYSKSPAKRALTAEKRRVSNKANKSELKTAMKVFEATLTGGNVDATKEQLLHATSLIDKGVSKGLIHKNTAARRKSAIAKKFNTLG